MKVGTKVIITDLSHKYLLCLGIVVFIGKKNQTVVELDNGILTIVDENELGLQ